ncbi:nucleoside-diphosphate-sugar epimerase [Opitutaceae bacterium TAV1]|nr:nucleoside-diphosphate-sugar epimerase [Opitutaceae bacterium TAV1]
MSNAHKTILVAGVQGIIGRHATEHYAAQPGATVVGLSRRPGDLPGVRHLSVDLLKPDEVREKLAEVKDRVTHAVFAAYIASPTAAERNTANVAILKNFLDIMEDAPALEHFTFYQGGKAYGSDLGPYKTPAREDDPRLMPPNFYYAQEELVRERQRGRSWHFTGFIPDAVCGFATGNPMNIFMVITIYATISRELGLPLRFPGSDAAWRALTQVTSADLLARATAWAGAAPAARNDVFNLTNGDAFRWQHLWPRIARMFRMEVADPVPMSLAEYMADKQPVWDSIVAKYQLQPVPWHQIAAWPFGDAVFGMTYDNVFNTLKIRRAGFHEATDTDEMFDGFLKKLRAGRVIPAFPEE